MWWCLVNSDKAFESGGDMVKVALQENAPGNAGASKN
jgi:hypothetical protein